MWLGWFRSEGRSSVPLIEEHGLYIIPICIRLLAYAMGLTFG